METPYMYLFVREDISHPQQIVQTAHAVDELGKKLSDTEQTNHMVLCGAKDEEDLWYVSEYLKEYGIAHEMFFESDISSYTAIATQPLRGDQRLPLRKFQLKR